MSTKLRAVRKEEKAQLRAMLSTYLAELHRYGDVEIDYPFFDSYWTDDDRWPYFIENDEKPLGFILVNTWSPSRKDTDFAVAEFYVLPDFRGAGIGKGAFAGLLKRHPGIWELGVMTGNNAARQFWERTITSAEVTDIERLVREDELIYRFATMT